MIFHQPQNSLGNYHYNFFRYSDLAYGPHFHRNYELVHVTTGCMELTVGGVCATLHEGESALVLSHQIHSFRVPSDSHAWVAVFSEEYVPKFASIVRGKQGSGFVFSMKKGTVELLEEALLMRESPSPNGESAALLCRKAGFYSACASYLESVSLEKRSDKNDLLIGQILDHIAENFREDIGMKQIAEKFGYEYHYLSRLLNQKYGINFRDLLTNYRLEAARGLLEENAAMPMALVAEKSGFGSLRTMNLAFRTVYGAPPGAFRR